MSNVQAQQPITNQDNFLTPILLITPHAQSQQTIAKKFLKQKLDWPQLTTGPRLSWINQAGETITIETIRDLIGELAYASHLGKKRAFVLLKANQLSSPAQHAFLKSLEEPPPNTQLILVTDQPQQLLPTIHSRCLKQHLAQINSSSQQKKQSQKLTTLPETLQTLITDPQKTNYQDLIKLATKHKDRTKAITLLQNTLTAIKHSQHISNTASLSRSRQLQQQLNTSLQQLQANLNTRLALENCFFQLKTPPNST